MGGNAATTALAHLADVGARSAAGRTRAITRPSLWLSAAFVGMVPVGVHAQTAPEGGAAAQPASVDDGDNIIVYAQKRGAERLQDVPLAITAFDGDALSAKGITNLQALTYSVPNVALDNLGPPLANFAIRGLSSNSSIPSLDPAVGTFVNGVYLGTNAGVVVDFFDIESVEVLRGPQGVLQGKNVAGGAVMIRTKRPSFDFGVAGKLSVNSFPGVTAAGSVEGPLSDVLAAKLTGYFSKDGGWAPNITVGRDQGRMQTWYARPSFLLKTDGLEVFLTMEIGKTNGDAPVERNTTFFQGKNFSKHATAAETICCTNIQWKQATAEINADVGFGDGMLTSITGWRDTRTFSVTDVDSMAARMFNLTGLTFAEQFSQELRYNGTFFDFWNVTVGGFYFKQTLRYFEPRDFGAIRTTFGGNVETTSAAAFMDNKFDLGAGLSLDAGLRYTYEQKKGQIAPQGAPLSSATSACNFDALTCVYSFSDTHTSKHVTTRLALDWKPSDDITLYVSRDDGLRSGGYNVRHTSPTVTPRATDDEEITSYEVGGKFSLFDRRLNLNFAAFQMDIDNILRDSVVFVDGVGFVQLNQNAGDARIRGFEVEATVRPAQGLRIQGSVGFLDNSYRKIFLDITGDQVVNQKDYALILPRLSKWSGSIGATYDFNVSGVGDFTLWGNFSYRSSAPYPDNNLTFLAAQSLFDASLTYKPSDQLSFTLWGRNLTDAARETSNTFSGAAIGVAAYTLPGRQFGMDVLFKF